LAVVPIKILKKEFTKMCKTCRRHHPELYVDKSAARPEKVKKAPQTKK